MNNYLFLLLLSVSCHQLNSQLQVTYVTGLWNIARDDMVIFKRPFDYYLKYFSDLLQTNHTFIIFGSREVKSFVENNQKYREKIFFVEKTLEDIQAYWYTPKIWENIDQVKKDWLKWQRYSILPQYGLRMYDPVVMSKMRIMMEASVVDPFNSDYYAWVDSGFTHSIGKAFIEKDVLGHFFRNYQPNWVFQVGDLNFRPFELGYKDEGRKYANITTDRRYYVWANWFGGKASAASTAYHIYQNFLRYTLQSREMNTEEAIFFLMLQRYSWIFQRANTLSFFRLNITTDIVQDGYTLRTINTSDIIETANLHINLEPQCFQEQNYINIIYDSERDVRYFEAISNSMFSCLRTRIWIVIGMIISLLCVRRCPKNRESTSDNNFYTY